MNRLYATLQLYVHTYVHVRIWEITYMTVQVITIPYVRT